jgi:very-short-patch-repair endonuclease
MSRLPRWPAPGDAQFGVFSRAQALEAGFSPHRIRRLLDDGRWVVVLGSVYADATARLSDVSLAWAAALGTGTGSIVSHCTAGRLWRYLVPPDPEVHVIVPRDARLRIPGVRAHRIEIVDAEVTRVAGIVCTSRLRTAVDCLLWLPEEAGRALMTDALRQRLLTVDEVRRELVRTPQRHGLTRAWSVMRDVARAPHSEAEVRVHRVLREARIDGWGSNVSLFDGDGLIGIVDLLFEDVKLVLEIDGQAYHSDDVAFQHDRSRQNRLVRAGYTVLRFTWDDIVHRPAEVIDTVRRMLQRLRSPRHAG